LGWWSPSRPPPSGEAHGAARACELGGTPGHKRARPVASQTNGHRPHRPAPATDAPGGIPRGAPHSHAHGSDRANPVSLPSHTPDTASPGRDACADSPGTSPTEATCRTSNKTSLLAPRDQPTFSPIPSCERFLRELLAKGSAAGLSRSKGVPQGHFSPRLPRRCDPLPSPFKREFHIKPRDVLGASLVWVGSCCGARSAGSRRGRRRRRFVGAHT
jgi:hypothetical protein